ncbi:MAG TPA: Sir2 family NAD-dependent protein deacetylase [Actinophytocola sp.]|jgi:NAD-dependent deacetylase|nr:Sir2 family NAD-dependent protein deacetylase [Actinophytocola sp.]
MRPADEVADAVATVAAASRIAVLSGAGISTESGIPDFRGPDGLWTKDPASERLSSLRAYRDDPEVRLRSWRTRRTHPVWDARPNEAHRALVTLEEAGRLHAILTQNIDGLHQRAGSSPDLVLELHGTMFDTVCLSCGDRGPMRAALNRVGAGEADPPCLACGGILKSATISFGQPLDAGVLARAREAAVTCDLMLAAGSSLAVQPAAGLVGLAARAGATVVICNGSETPYDRLAAFVLRDRLGSVLPELVRGS